MKKRCLPLLLTALLLSGCVRLENGSRLEAAQKLFGVDTDIVETPVSENSHAQEIAPSGSNSGTNKQENSEPDARDSLVGQKPPKQTAPPITFDYSSCYSLRVDNTGLVRRSAGAYDSDMLTWVVEANGSIQLERNAENEMTYRPMNYGGGIIRVWLKAWIDGGYEVVSNTVEIGADNSAAQYDGAGGFERDRISRQKQQLKNLARHIGDCEYKLGFIIDPDHDGNSNGIAFYAGINPDGQLKQIIFDHDRDDLLFSRFDYLEDGNDCTLGIWLDPHSGRDYIVRLDSSGMAFDCVTGQQIDDFDENVNYFSFNGSEDYDCDHFAVSHQGILEMENA
ncbi:MAG: hypothetical protein MJ065_00960 [Oscillospiraceae bacterium]|nr:hypothetical protein [Oscillospiraceae bacterium]